MEQQRNFLARVSEGLSGLPDYRMFTEYNIFSVLEIEAREVLMCRFLADLLSPEGAHGCGSLFLRGFLEDILSMEGLSATLLENTVVEKEYVIDDERRIDIVIRNSLFFIPIEVKIYAGEQESQCFDYYECAKKHWQDAFIVYLTRFADEPSEYSRKTLSPDRIRCIGWERDVLPWLLGFSPRLEAHTASNIRQFADAVHRISDTKDSVTMEKTVGLIMESADNFRAALQIEKHVKEAKLALIRAVFEEFQRQMESYCALYGLDREEEARYYVYDEAGQERFYDCYSTFPGLNYVVRRAKLKNEDIRIWFRIEAEHRLFAGFCVFDMAAEPENGRKTGDQLDDITPELYAEAAGFINREIFIPGAGWWLSYVYPNGRRAEKDYGDVPDFKNMNACAVSLTDENARKEYVQGALKVFEEKLLKNLIGES